MRSLQLSWLALPAALVPACQLDPTAPGRDVFLPISAEVVALESRHDGNAPVHLHPHDGEVTTTQSVAGTANLGMRFSSVEQACLEFEFSDDLLDFGDELAITVDGSDAGSFFPPGAESQATRTFCWEQAFHPSTIADFVDGKAKFDFIARTGSITLASVTLTISGAPR